MADEATTSTEETQITFNVKSSSDAKYVLTVPANTTIADLKTKLSTSEYADLPVERQRLIYSGRVLKDLDTLASLKIKDGHTVHLVKGAASNARQNPAAQGSASTTSGSTPAAPQLPTNIATGTGNSPFAHLTGARYAGFHGLPNADTFGPDGGMGPPPDADHLLEMMDNPMFLSQMNEMMNNPDVIDMISQNPMIRNNPYMQTAIRDPNFRRMMFSPEAIRLQVQAQRAMNQNSGGNFPAPGVTNTTPQTGTTATGEGTTATPNQPNTTGPTQTPQDPLAALFGGGGGGNAGGANPFAALLENMGGGNPFATAANPNPGTTPAQSPPNTASAGQGTPANATPAAQPPNPFGNLFGGAGQQGQQGANPMADMTRQLMQNPEAMRAAMQMMSAMGGGGGASPFGGAAPSGDTGAGNTGAAGAGAGAGAGANPFAALFGPGGMGGFGGGFGSPPPPQDNRPPEQVYESQLRQLNDMGFFDFERNVQALRRSGGSVQGAIEHLLSSS